MDSPINKTIAGLLSGITPTNEVPLSALVPMRSGGATLIKNFGNGARLNYGTDEMPDWRSLESLSNEQLEWISVEIPFLSTAAFNILLNRRSQMI